MYNVYFWPSILDIALGGLQVKPDENKKHNTQVQEQQSMTVVFKSSLWGLQLQSQGLLVSVVTLKAAPVQLNYRPNVFPDLRFFTLCYRKWECVQTRIIY